MAERIERHPQHLLGPVAHLGQDLDERRIRLDVGDELRQLRDRHAAVRAPLQQEIDVDHREQESQVARDRRLQRKERLDRLLDAEEVVVDLVVEGDHLVGELAIALLEGAHSSVDGAEDALPHLLELRLDLLERRVDRHHEPGYYLALRAGARAVHHFVSTSQRRRIPPSPGRAVPWPANP